MDPSDLPCYADVEAAATRIAAHAHRTPVLTSRTLDARLQAQVFIKAEQFQRVGAFKFRGACNAIAAMAPARRAAGVIAYSSGNHAQAVALAARLHDTRATVLMPADAPRAKVEATRGYGAQIQFFDRHTESREQLCAALVAERGLTLVPPFDHPDVIAGQGTATRELLQDTGPLDALVVGLGGGGLLGGACLAATALSPGCQLYGVEPEAGNDGQQSLQAGQVVTIAPPRTVADGATTTFLGRYTFAILRRHVRSIVTVSDAQLVEAMAFLAERMKLLVEPTACLGLAALLAGALDVRGQRVGLILSGGNVDLDSYARLLQTARGP
ncbi:threo-3-hydroxy-L-aspartate ammonia-lyase [Stenotrophomonas sp. 24(2023)]|uniref:threo-3-hydroxy-L-aspartate ammonia-lyase n=1 Tax=Stenotrophomonas sp. 24(2023) TaxID=3068324 RepID=UPI0027E03D8F|nr:threo-3-hydroxy-L-aspartate ammonia-lyase [Stenotrophomonas sp. 24(2023)]WMJ69291.1 threo-3-hydroxy-L-aspartate ammonia-lyase [Stenotrophomonas sp. 24(2023)]